MSDMPMTTDGLCPFCDWPRRSWGWDKACCSEYEAAVTERYRKQCDAMRPVVDAAEAWHRWDPDPKGDHDEMDPSDRLADAVATYLKDATDE